MNDDSIMFFGKHKGKTLEEVPAKFLLEWHWKKNKKLNKYHKELQQYIIDNYDVLMHQYNGK